MNQKHVQKGHERLIERRAAVSELLALVQKQEVAAAEAVRLAEVEGK
jgi:hypothetical protein